MKNRIITGIITLTKDAKAGLSLVLEWLSSPPKQKAQTNLSYLLRISKLATVYAALMIVGTILIFTSLASAEQARPSTLTVPVGAKVTVNWKNAPKKMTKKKVVWYNGKKKVSANVKSRKSQKYTSKKDTTIKVSVKYKGKKKKTDVKKIKFVAVEKLGYLTPTEDTLKSGQATTIYWKGAPSGIDTKQVKWTVSDSSIASISSNGTSAKIDSAAKEKSGTVTVTLKYYGKVIGKATVKVTAKADAEDNDSDTSIPYTAKYTYQIYPIRPEYTVYNQGEYYYYLKTDNPDRNSMAYDYQSNGNSYPCAGTPLMGTTVADIELTEILSTFTFEGVTYNTYGNHVAGGYVFSRNGGAVGTNTIVIYEKNPALGATTGDYTNPSHYAKVCEYTFTVVDYDTAYAAEVERIANEAKTSSTDFWEQCSKAVGIIIRDYRYPKLGATTEHCGTKLNSKFLDCVDASSLMCAVAKKLGATSTEQASDGTAHAFAKVTYNGDTKEYDATPGGGTEYTDQEMAALKVDFSKFQ